MRNRKLTVNPTECRKCVKKLAKYTYSGRLCKSCYHTKLGDTVEIICIQQQKISILTNKVRTQETRIHQLLQRIVQLQKDLTLLDF